MASSFLRSCRSRRAQGIGEQVAAAGTGGEVDLHVEGNIFQGARSALRQLHLRHSGQIAAQFEPHLGVQPNGAVSRFLSLRKLLWKRDLRFTQSALCRPPPRLSSGQG
jgi:hypothetical protein